jgi:hypothetical protein
MIIAVYLPVSRPVSPRPTGFRAWFQRMLGRTPPAEPRRQVDERPMIPVRIIGPTGLSMWHTGLLDTGSTETMFPIEVAQAIGVILQGSPAGYIRWRGVRYPVRRASVKLQLSNETTRWVWETTIAFSPAPLAYILLGDRGCLQYLDAKFCGGTRTVELETNRTFPGEVISG